MPQMAPMSWLMLFMFFTMTLVFVMNMNYYLYIPKLEESETNKLNETKMMNWKW